MDPELFFPAPSESPEPAVETCHTCPVQGACLAWALNVGDLHGVWGGTTARERRAMAVVWRSWHSAGIPSQGVARGSEVPATELARDPAFAPATVTDTAPLLGAELRSGAEALSPRPRHGDDVTEVQAVMDRAELLRLVRAT